MDLKEALTVANTFILLQLGGQFGTVVPLSASYDEDEENWEIKCEFKRVGTGKLETVTLWIDDEAEEVVSFEIE